jgi:hypothetical protein
MKYRNIISLGLPEIQLLAAVPMQLEFSVVKDHDEPTILLFETLFCTWECFNMGTELPTKIILGQTLVLMQITFLNNVRKVGRLVLSRTFCFKSQSNMADMFVNNNFGLGLILQKSQHQISQSVNTANFLKFNLEVTTKVVFENVQCIDQNWDSVIKFTKDCQLNFTQIRSASLILTMYTDGQWQLSPCF